MRGSAITMDLKGEEMEATTKTKTFVICPHCRALTDSDIDHIPDGMNFGVWFCDECGGGFRGVKRGNSAEVKKDYKKFVRTLDLIALKREGAKMLFVVDAMQSFRDSESESEATERKKAHYENDACPDRILKNVCFVSNGTNLDPHGEFQFIRSVPVEHEGYWMPDEDIAEMFPELVGVEYKPIL